MNSSSSSKRDLQYAKLLTSLGINVVLCMDSTKITVVQDKSIKEPYFQFILYVPQKKTN